MDIPARLLNGLLMIALPLGLGVFLARRLGPRWGLYGAGAVTFIASQVLHVPFNAWILNPRLEGLGFGARGLSRELIVSAILLGLSSGVFEEGARYLTLRFWQQQARSWRQALMIGAGHGGAEAIIVGILALMAFFQAVAYRGADLAAIVPAEQLAAAEAQIEAYWAAPWPEALLGAVERAFSLVVHLALAVMVMRVFTRRNRLWLAAAIGWHALVNILAVIGVQTVGAVATEGIVGVMALLSLGLIFLLRDKEADTVSEPARPIPQTEPAVIEPSEARLEDSRYAD